MNRSGVQGEMSDVFASITDEQIEEKIMDFKECLRKSKEMGLDVKLIYNQLINTEPYCNNGKKNF